jgi:hypothetical protein
MLLEETGLHCMGWSCSSSWGAGACRCCQWQGSAPGRAAALARRSGAARPGRSCPWQRGVCFGVCLHHRQPRCLSSRPGMRNRLNCSLKGPLQDGSALLLGLPCSQQVVSKTMRTFSVRGQTGLPLS